MSSLDYMIGYMKVKERRPKEDDKRLFVNRTTIGDEEHESRGLQEDSDYFG